jgi:hypothetical protein
MWRQPPRLSGRHEVRPLERFQREAVMARGCPIVAACLRQKVGIIE